MKTSEISLAWQQYFPEQESFSPRGIFVPFKPKDSLQSHSHGRRAAAILLNQNTSKTQDVTNAYEDV